MLSLSILSQASHSGASSTCRIARIALATHSLTSALPLRPCTPRLLQDLFPKAAELYERVASNREHWTKVSHKFTIRGLPSNNSLDFLDEEYEVPDLDGTRAPVNGCCSLDAE